MASNLEHDLSVVELREASEGMGPDKEHLCEILLEFIVDRSGVNTMDEDEFEEGMPDWLNKDLPQRQKEELDQLELPMLQFLEVLMGLIRSKHVGLTSTWDEVNEEQSARGFVVINGRLIMTYLR